MEDQPYSWAPLPSGDITSWWKVTGPQADNGLTLLFPSPDTAAAVAQALNRAYQDGGEAARLAALHQPAGYQAGYADGADQWPCERAGLCHPGKHPSGPSGRPRSLPADDLLADTMGTVANWPDPGAAGNR